MKGRKVCYHHGGASPAAGPTHPNYKHGRYSGAMPSHLVDRYVASLQDEDLLNLASELAILDTRIGELLQRVDEGRRNSEAIDTAWVHLSAVAEGDDIEAIRAAVADMGSAMNADRGVAAEWQEIYVVIDQRRRLVNVERRRRLDMETMLTPAQAAVFVSRLLEAVKTHVSDRAILAAIGAEFAALTNWSGGGRIQAAGGNGTGEIVSGEIPR